MYAVTIQGRLASLPTSPAMVGSAVATMLWSSAANSSTSIKAKMSIVTLPIGGRLKPRQFDCHESPRSSAASYYEGGHLPTTQQHKMPIFTGFLASNSERLTD